MFVFHPELFDAKAKAQDALANAGIMWLSDYSACDLLHEEYGLEIEGIHSERMANSILEILYRTFSHWRVSYSWHSDRPDARWCVALCKLKRSKGEAR